MEARRSIEISLSEISLLPSVTTDGTKIELLGNIEAPSEIPGILKAGGDGVGLYRTEFLFLTGNSEPTEADHFAAYKDAITLLGGKPLTIRTVDLGADKYTQEQQENPERNPFLGLRSIRYCLQSLPMFKRQLRAILRASALGPVKVMFPLITTISELRQGKYLLNDVMEDLAEEGVAFDASIPVGMMVEVPSAAVLAPVFARESAFFSIGTNDLVQYTLAVDRTNERVAGLYNPFHPAVIHLVRDVIRAGRHVDIPVSCCGETAGDPEYALLLIGLGLRTLSVTSSSIPALKRVIRGVSVQSCEKVAKKAASLDSEASVGAYVRDQARRLLPEAFDGRSGD
jgi:phosphoenolpyruvate-protein phosphotransferase (PTS system enzyme I)